jgi:hypothetical protein
MIRTSVQVDVALMDTIHEQIFAIERQINSQVPDHDPVAIHLLRTIPGVGKILALVIFYEIQDINRFPRVGNFISYAPPEIGLPVRQCQGALHHCSETRAYRVRHAQKEDPFRLKNVL